MDSDKKSLILYLTVFYVVWTLRTILLMPYVTATCHSPFIVESTRNMTKIIIWLVPLYLYLSFFERRRLFSYLRMDRDILLGMGLGLSAGVLFFLFRAAGFFAVDGGLRFNAPFIGHITGGVIFAGIIEEQFFRGFVLQKIECFTSFWKANIMCSFLFTLSHAPSWVYHSDHHMVLDGLKVFIFGIFLGWLFKRSGSLWSAIVFHSTYNLVVLVL